MLWRYTHGRSHDLLSLGGWLFADLLLALAMLFFTSSIIVAPTHSAKPTPTPKAPPLILDAHRATLTIDVYGILSNAPDAIRSVEQQVRALRFLRNRHAGLVIAYNGAPTDNQVSTAITISRKIYSILAKLGKQGFVFTHAKYYAPLFVLGGNENIVILDIYLFAS